MEQQPSPLQRQRRRRDWTQAQVVDRLRQLAWQFGYGELGIDANAVSRHERGVIRKPRSPLPDLYAELYQTTVEALWPGSRASGTLEATPEARRTRVRRREFTRLAGGLAAGLAADALPLADSTSRPRVDEALIGDLRETTARLRRADDRIPARELLGPAQSHLRLVTRLLESDPPLRAELAAVASEAASFTAWLWFDSDAPAAARAHYRTAIRRAREAGHPTLSAYQLGSLSALAAYTGDGTGAVRLILAAKEGVGPEAPAVARAWLAASEAAAYATARDSHATLAALDRAGAAAEDAAGAGRPTWPWMFAFDPVKVAAYAGAAQVRLGRSRHAQAALARVVQVRSAATKQKALVLADLGAAYAQQRAIDEACQQLRQALGIAIDKDSEKARRRVLDVRRTLDPWRNTEPVRALDRQLLTAWL
jgi:tetratricopeptide (TPR) repeat protein